jgi:hypothetical protein
LYWWKQREGFRKWQEFALFLLNKFLAEPELESLPIQGSLGMCLMPQEKPVKDLAANPSAVQK